MQLSNNTVAVLKNFSSINPNLVVKEGSKIETISPSKDVIAVYESSDTFDTQLAIFNLNEFLGVLSAFKTPELELDTKFLTFTEGKQKVKFVYADESLLITPPEKPIKFPNADISFSLKDDSLATLQKMSAILAAEDLSVVGDGKTISLKIHDKKNDTSNAYELDTEVPTADKFQINFKIDKMKLVAGNYTVDISNKKISRFTNEALNLVYFIAVENDSTFA